MLFRERLFVLTGNPLRRCKLRFYSHQGRVNAPSSSKPIRPTTSSRSPNLPGSRKPVQWIRASKPQGNLAQLVIAGPRKNQIVQLTDAISAKGLSSLLHVRTVDILKELIKLNLCPRHSEDILDKDEIFGKIPNRERSSSFDRVPRPVPDDLSSFPVRAPVVAVMGHVNHGKTTLLDAIRNTAVAHSEHGGITQKMAAFSVPVPSVGTTITFIDTPGHAAFETMRRRGAATTDICILVVAADDGVQEQTIEALKSIEEAGSRLIVALNKIDKKAADPARVKRQLIAAGVQFEESGGDVPLVEMSGLKGTGVEKLLETIAILAGDMDLRADRSGEAEAVILDTRREDWRGNTASCIIRMGTLKLGDCFVAGYAFGSVKYMSDTNGNSLKEALPGTPVDVYGWVETPNPGEDLMVVRNIDMAENIAKYRFDRDNKVAGNQDYARKVREEMDEMERAVQDRLKAIELGEDPEQYVIAQRKLRESLQPREVPVLVKADSGGSIEAINDALRTFDDREVKIRVIRATVGPITESDIQEASLANPKATVVGFNVPLSAKLVEQAKKLGVPANSFKIIYGMTDWMKALLSKMLKPTTETVVTSQAEVLQLFSITQRKQVFMVAGCKVTEGVFKRGKKVQLVRDGRILWEGPVRNLKHLKQDVPLVQAGKECGIMLDEDVQDIQPGDIIRTVEKKSVEREIGIADSSPNYSIPSHL